MSNLPDNVTVNEIDDKYGGKEARLTADVTVSVSAKALADDSKDRKEELIWTAVEEGYIEDLIQIDNLEEEPL